MTPCGRRTLLRTAVAATAWQAGAQTPPAGRMRLGIILSLAPDADTAIRCVQELGFTACQLTVRETGDAAASSLRAALDRDRVEATSAVSH